MRLFSGNVTFFGRQLRFGFSNQGAAAADAMAPALSTGASLTPPHVPLTAAERAALAAQLHSTAAAAAASATTTTSAGLATQGSLIGDRPPATAALDGGCVCVCCTVLLDSNVPVR